MRIDEALQLAQTLEGEDAKVDVEHLLCEVLQQARSYLYTWPERELDEAQQHQFDDLLAKRRSGIPVAHLLGRRAFWTFELEVNPSTLIPRADTEVLVEFALELCEKPAARVADLGTGTGAIALALAMEHPDWEVVACDRIVEAVALASANAERLKTRNLRIVQGSWFEPLIGQFDLIVSNPPYIDPIDPHLERGDLRFEPLSALTADECGMADLRQIIVQAPDYLTTQGWLVLEHGFDQAEAVAELLRQRGFSDIRQRRDFGGNMRVSAGCWCAGTAQRSSDSK
ncbi:MAG: peptide chain release factor N(5)-glutamine methyltransferase [Oceanospirillaceae bacterium]|nr:peptide chain release factor N(5)-glutamine methyltransferase [Oceanospirillaceae bacterium]